MIEKLPEIKSLRDAFAFKAHVESSAKEGGRQVVSEYYKYPVFYYANHLNISGPGPIYVYKEHLDKLDFELEVAIIIGKKGLDIKASEADQYISGFTIMNDFSARQIQWNEMKVKLGPHKGKDFATSLGPEFIKKESLEQFRSKTSKGSHWNLKMEAFLNEVKICSGNLNEMTFTFGEIIERASHATTIFPGEYIGSGTVGGGCLREYNYFQRKKNPDHKDIWLKPGDQIRLVVEGMGELVNNIVLKS